MTDNGLIFKISKQLVQLNNKQITQFKKIRRSKYTSFQRRHTYGQQLHEKMLNITNHQRNANQTKNEIPPHTCQNSYDIKRITNNKYWQGFREKGTLALCW